MLQHPLANQYYGQTFQHPQGLVKPRCYSDSKGIIIIVVALVFASLAQNSWFCVSLGLLCVSSGTSTDMYRERSLSLPTDNVPRQGGALQHMPLQCAHSVTHPTAEMHHSGDPLFAPTTHLSRYSSSGS